MDRHLRSVAIMIEVTSRHTECTHFNLDYSQMLCRFATQDLLLSKYTMYFLEFTIIKLYHAYTGIYHHPYIQSISRD